MAHTLFLNSVSQTNGLTTGEPHEPELFSVQDEPKPIIIHVEPESLTVQAKSLKISPAVRCLYWSKTQLKIILSL